MAEKSVVRRLNYCKNTRQELPCEECGETFTSVRRGHRFCSWECSRKYIKRTKPFVPKTVECRLCGKSVIQKTAWQTFCSSSCRGKWYRNPAARNRSKKCSVCRKSFVPSKRWSETFCSADCRKKGLAKAVEKHRRKNSAQGLCHTCSKPRFQNSSYLCLECWFNKTAVANGIRSRNAGESIKAILEAQKYECPYTGKKLTPGINASVDHVKPKSRFPELTSSLSNIEWVDINVNIAKRNMTKFEFISLCKLISSRCK